MNAAFLSSETGFDISQTFAIGKLSKRHDQVLVVAAKLFHIAVTMITLNTSMKGV